jgi:hypothetical protein
MPGTQHIAVAEADGPCPSACDAAQRNARPAATDTPMSFRY